MINYDFCKMQLEALKHNSILIHASAVCRNTIVGKNIITESIIFCGPTESGKTRYMIEFCQKGWKCLGDDFVLIKDGYIYGCFLEGCHMKYERGVKMPIRKLPLYWFYKAVRAFTNRRPHVFLTPKELGIKTAFKAKIDRIVFLKRIKGKDIADKVFINTKNKGEFDEFKNGKYLPKMEKIIRKSLNENTVIETTVDLARQF